LTLADCPEGSNEGEETLFLTAEIAEIAEKKNRPEPKESTQAVFSLLSMCSIVRNAADLLSESRQAANAWPPSLPAKTGDKGVARG
jgi:hypothetical protein